MRHELDFNCVLGARDRHGAGRFAMGAMIGLIGFVFALMIGAVVVSRLAPPKSGVGAEPPLMSESRLWREEGSWGEGSPAQRPRSARQRAGVVPDQALKARVKALGSAKPSRAAVSAIDWPLIMRLCAASYLASSARPV